MGGKEGDEVPASTWLTQLGHVKTRRSLNWARFDCSFRCCPGPNDEGYLSLLEGRLTVEETVPLIARGDSVGGADCVRHAEAGTLTKAGFRVIWAPLPKLPGHVAVYFDRPWDEDISEKFDECFTDFLKGW
jgi:hypothetical protein